MRRTPLGNLLGKLGLLLAVALATVAAHCGTMTGTIASITYSINTPNFVFVYLSASSTGTPACAATQPNRMTLDLSTPMGKSLYANLLALKLTNPAGNVTLYGSNACSAWGDTENIHHTFL